MFRNNGIQKADPFSLRGHRRRKSLHFIVFSTLMAVILGCVAAHGEEWRFDEGFEKPNADGQQPVGWTVSNGTLILDDAVAFNGKHSMKLTATPPFDGTYAAYRLTAKGEDEVRFSLYMRGYQVHTPPDVLEGAKVWLVWHDSDGSANSIVKETQPLSGTFKWQELTGKTILPTEAVDVDIRIGFGKGVSGTIWIDEVSVSVEASKILVGEELATGVVIGLVIVLFPLGFAIGIRRVRAQHRDLPAYEHELAWEKTRAVLRTRMLQQGISRYYVDNILRRMDDNPMLRQDLLVNLDLPLEQLPESPDQQKDSSTSGLAGCVVWPLFLVAICHSLSWKLIVPGFAGFLGYFVAIISHRSSGR
jgi:hypothetical protein